MLTALRIASSQVMQDSQSYPSFVEKLNIRTSKFSAIIRACWGVLLFTLMAVMATPSAQMVSPPSGLTITHVRDTVTGDRTLTWTLASNGGEAVTYRLQRTRADAGDGADSATPTQLVELENDSALSGTYIDTEAPGGSRRHYIYGIRATNSAGAVVAGLRTTGVVSGVTSEPRNLMLGEVTATTVALDWEPPASDGNTGRNFILQGYRIERAQGANAFMALPQITASTTIMHIDTTVMEATTYRYRVRSTNPVGESAPSNIVTATTAAGAPATPTNLTAGATDTIITLNWGTPENRGSEITGYQIERAEGGGAFAPITPDPALAGDATSYTDIGLSPVTQYSYRVSAINTIGTGDFAAVSLTTLVEGVSAAPTSLLAMAGSDALVINLQWTAPTDTGDSAITGYQIERSQGDGSGTFDIVAANHANTSYTDMDGNLLASTQYSYRVFAINDQGTGATSEIASATTAALVVAPSGLTIMHTRAGNTITLTWMLDSNGGEAVTYRLQRVRERSGNDRVITDDMILLPAADNSVTMYVDTNTVSTRNYIYGIMASNSAGSVAAATQTRGDFSLATVSSAPLNLMLDGVTATTVSLVWDEPADDGVSGRSNALLAYQIERAEGLSEGAFMAFPLHTDTETAAYTDTTALAETTYRYRVRATNPVGDSAASNIITATTLVEGVPAAPTGLMAVASDSTIEINLSWQAPADTGDSAITGYRIERSQGDGSGTFDIVEASHASTSYTDMDSSLLANTQYSYRVSAINDQGTGIASEIASATTLSAPLAPTGLMAVASDSTIEISLSWQAPTGIGSTAITGYQIERSQGDGSGTFDIVEASHPDTSYTDMDSSLLANTQYSYRVSAINDAGTGVASEIASATVSLPPAAPTGLMAVASDSTIEISLSWQAPADIGSTAITGYQIERSQGDGSGTFDIVEASHPSTSYTDMDSSLLASTQYSYRVSAINDGGTGVASDIESATTVAVLAPSGLTITHTRTGNTITLNWALTSDGGEAVTYRLQRSRETAGSDRLIRENTILLPAADDSVTMYVDTDTVSTRNYIYGIMASNSAGAVAAATQTRGDFSLATVPSAPLNLMLDGVTATTVSLVWEEPADDGVSGRANALLAYQIERAEGLSEGVFMAFPLHTDTETAAYTDTTALAGTTYRYRVRANNPVGDSAASNIITATTPAEGAAAAPTGLMAVASDSTIEISLSWQAPADTGDSAITGYRIERSQGDGSGTFDIVVASHASTSYTDTDSSLLANTQYSYRVFAINDQGTGVASEIASATTNAAAIVAPSGLTLAATPASDTEVNLSWSVTDNGGEAVTYSLERSEDSGLAAATPITLSSNTDTLVTDTGLTASTQYYYRVTAMNSVGSVMSAIETATTDAAAIVAPSGLTLAATPAGSTEIMLSWSVTDNGGEAVTYSLERSEDSGLAAATPITLSSATDTSVTDTGLTASTQYYYRVTAMNSVGSVMSAIETATTDAAAIVAPSGLTLAATPASDTEVNLSWSVTDNGGEAVTYSLERSEDSGLAAATPITLSSNTDTSVTDTGLTASTQYYYRVTAMNSVGSVLSAIETATTDAAAIVAPSGLTLMATPAGATEIMLSWSVTDNGGEAVTYSLERSEDSGLAAATPITLGSNTDTLVTDTGLTASTQYYYRVTAMNSVGSVLSAIETATTNAAAIVAPSGLTLAATPAGSTEVNLSWSVTDNGGEAVTYSLERSEDSGLAAATPITLSSNTDTLVTDTGLTASTQYYYRVTAMNSVGSVLSAIETATTDAAAIVAPSGLTLMATPAGSTEVNLSWSVTDNGGEAVTYSLERSEDSGLAAATPITLSSNTDTLVTDTGLTASTQYYYRVTAMNSVGSVLSAIETATTDAAAIVAPSGLTLTATPAGATEIMLSWSVTDNGGEAVTYSLERSEDSGLAAATPITLSSATDTLVTDTGLTASTQYYYRVTAMNSVGSVLSAIETATTDAAAIVAPSGLTLMATPAGATEVNLSWSVTDNGGEAVTYSLERSEDSGLAAATPITLSSNTDTLVTDTGLTASTQYYYRVTAMNSVGSVMSAIETATTDAAAIVAPSGLTLAATPAGSTEIMLSWSVTDNGGEAVTYSLERSEDSGLAAATPITLSSATDTSVTDTGLTASTQYYYRVTAMNSVGSVMSAIETATTDAAAIVAPSGLTLAATPASDTEVNLSWSVTDNGGEAVTYSLERSEDSGLAAATPITLSSNTDTSVTDTGLTASTQYYYRVTAMNSVGSVLSAIETATTDAAAIVAPSGLTLMATPAGATEIMLSWSVTDNGGEAVTYSLERSEDSGLAAATPITLGSNTDTLVTDTGLTASTQYYYRVTAMNSVGSVLSAIETATTNAAAIVAPSGLTLAATPAGSTEVNLSWSVTDNGGEAVTYSLERSEDSGLAAATPITLSSNTDTLVTDTGLTASTQYYYRVTAMNSVGSVLSAIETATTDAAAIVAPSGLTLMATPAGSTEIMLSWSVTDNGGEAVTYSLERSEDSGLAAATPITLSSNTDTLVTDTGLTASTQYYYRVTAMNSVGSVLSAIETATTNAAAIVAPSGLTLTATPAGATEIMLSWSVTDNGGEAVTYSLERSEDSGLAAATPITLSSATDTLVTDTGLTASTQYYYRVTAMNSVGSVLSAIETATTDAAAIVAPSGLTLMATPAGATEVNLSWSVTDNGGEAVTYSLERSEDSGLAAATPITLSSNTDTLVTDTGLTASTQYYYRVTAMNSVGSVMSAIETATTDAAAIVAPSGLTLAATPAGSTEIMLSWSVTDNGGEAVTYSLERSEDSGLAAATPITLSSNTDTSVTDTGLTASTQYYYRVTAMNSVGSVLSAIETATTDAAAIVAPSGLTLAATPAGSTEVNLSWSVTDNGGEAVTYSLERSEDSGLAAATPITLSSNTDTSVTDTGLTASTQYYYRVTAMNSVGSVLSAIETATTDAAAIVAPSGLTLAATPAGSTEVNLSWSVTDNGGEAVTYSLERSEDSGLAAATPITLSSNTDTSVTDTGLTASTQYYYRVTAMNSVGSVLSAIETATTDAAAIVAPSGLTLAATPAGATEIMLSWSVTDNGGEAVTYSLERSEDSGLAAATPITLSSATDTSVTDTGLTASTQYYYRVTAMNSVGSVLSAIETATTDAAAIVAPSGLTLTATPAGATEIMLSWSVTDNGGEAVTYSLERSEDSGLAAATPITLSSATDTLVTDTGLTASTQYYYRVTAMNSVGSVLSAIETATTDAAAIVAPSGLTLMATPAGSTEVNLSWSVTDNGGEAVTYSLERSEDSGLAAATPITLSSNTDTSVTDTGLTASTQYYYRVTAMNSVGSVLSAIETATTDAAAIVAPSGLTLAATPASDTEVNLSWSVTDNGGEAVTYSLERSEDSGLAAATPITLSSNTDTLVTDTGLTASTQYYYRVTAMNSVGSVMSAIETATTNAAAIVAPSGLTLTATPAGSTEIMLSWSVTDNGGEAVTYSLERSLNADLSAATTLTLTPNTLTEFTDTGLEASTQYYYRVTAMNSVGSVMSAIETATTDAAAIVAPSGLTLMATPASDTEVNLSWSLTDNGGEAVTYSLERSLNADLSVAITLTLTPNTLTEFTDTGLTASTQYYYRVTAMNSVGSVLSAIETATTDAAAIVAPSGLTLTATPAGSTEVNLSWSVTDNGGEAVTYSLERSLNADLSVAITLTLTPNTLTEFTDTGLEAGTQYYYRVTATNSEGSVMSDIETATGGLPEQVQALNESLLPNVVQATSAISLSAISNRIDAVLSGAVGNQPTFAGADTGYDMIKQLGSDLSSEQELSDMLLRWLGNSSFSHSFAGSELAANANISVWGSGDYKDLQDDKGALRWDGDVWGAQLGADIRINDWLLGTAVSWSSGEFDYTDGETTSAGDYDYENFGIHPYWNWAPSGENYNIWGSLSYGQGDITIQDQAMPDEVSSDTSQYGVAAGINISLHSAKIAHARDAIRSFNLKGDVSALWVDIDGAGESIISETIKSQRFRILLSGEHDYIIGVRRHLIPSVELGARYETGSSDNAAGAEVTSSLTYKDLLTGFTLSGQINAFLGQEYDEWGASALLRFGDGGSSRGLSFSLEPTIGRASSDPARLWQQEASSLADNSSRHGSSSLSAALVSEISYGMGMHSAFSVPATWQPYANMELGSAIRRYRLGLRYQFVQGLGFRIEGQSLHSSGASTINSNTGKDYGVQLKTEFEF